MSASPNGSGQHDINAATQVGTGSRAPDVLDIGKAVTLANTPLYAPYKVATWGDILYTQKDPNGLWWQDYGGYWSFRYSSNQVAGITFRCGLFKPEAQCNVAFNGQP